ncbi:unnamed protein product [Protopolystoma xenopodis]|uniref:Uncharacterized protein n=1 Tax=Protopolystoma xenopodis TaxID=117903 RepID=A0A448WJ21_9PLAT|nr:unnamed protein product [Protopolystoma xenopodis]
MAMLTDDAGDASGNVPCPRYDSGNYHAYYGLRISDSFSRSGIDNLFDVTQEQIASLRDTQVETFTPPTSKASDTIPSDNPQLTKLEPSATEDGSSRPSVATSSETPSVGASAKNPEEITEIAPTAHEATLATFPPKASPAEVRAFVLPQLIRFLSSDEHLHSAGEPQPSSLVAILSGLATTPKTVLLTIPLPIITVS